MSWISIVLLCVGLCLLVGGAELLVRGASRLAVQFGISPLIIGLTIVAMGTSAPEIAVSTVASLNGQPDIALGNVVGSNIFNILLILGVSALITPLVVAQQLVRLDVPLMIVASFLLLFFSLDRVISSGEGALLLTGIIFYTIFLIVQARGEKNAAVQSEYEHEFGGKASATSSNRVVQLALIAGGLVLLVAGSRWLVDGAVEIASGLGVSELVISLTIIAAGTSLPEVATSVIASLRKERDIAVGNAVGSNIFNLLAVMGIASTVAPTGIPVPNHALAFDLPIMVAVAVACLPIFFTGHRIARWEGFLFLGYYIAYMTYIVFAASQNELLPLFRQAMLLFVIPVTVITLGVVTWHAWRTGRAGVE